MFKERFLDQVVVIVGGGRGIGLATARRLAAEGAQVICLDISESSLEDLSTKARLDGYSIATQILDVRDEQEVQRVFDEVARDFGRIDVLINCAAIIGETSMDLVQTDSAVFVDTLQVNLVGAYYVTKHVLPHMIEKGYGRILHVSSIGGKEGNPGMAGYATSKAGLIGLIKAAGKEYAKMGITVNGLAPAVIATPMNASTNDEMLDYMKGKIPMGRLGTVHEVAAIICWIVSHEASFNTGFIFDLSGGRATY